MSNELRVRYNQLLDESVRYGDHNDCTVKALSMIYDMSYNDSHKLCFNLGRKHNKGFNINLAINFLGRASKPYLPKQPNGCNYTVKTIIHALPIGKYFVFTKGHVLACIDGVIYDWTEDRQHRVIEVIEIDSIMDIL